MVVKHTGPITGKLVHFILEFCLYTKDPYNPFLSLFQTVQSIPRQFPVQTTDFPVFHWIKKPRSTNSLCKDVAFYDSDVLQYQSSMIRNQFLKLPVVDRLGVHRL